MSAIDQIEQDEAERISAILQGAVDPHVHSGPSIAPRAIDHLNLAKELSGSGFAAIVTKDHDYSGVMCAKMIADHYPDLKTKVFSGIVLNNVVGGLNPYAVEHTAASGGKIVWISDLHVTASGMIGQVPCAARLAQAVEQINRWHGDADCCIATAAWAAAQASASVCRNR